MKFKKLPLHKRPYLAKRVLEIGGGHFPFKGVTHAVDKYPDKNYQRAHDFTYVKGVKFIEGDLENLPFDETEEQFDFAYASHVLEHTDTPEKAIQQLNKFTKSGYIETPSPLREQLMYPGEFDPNYYHKIFVWLEDGELHYIPIRPDTLHTFSEGDAYAQAVKRLYQYAKNTGTLVEPILPRASKYMMFYYQSPMQIHRHESFDAALAAGKNPYKNSIDQLIRRIQRLDTAFSSKTRKMKKICEELAIG